MNAYEPLGLQLPFLILASITALLTLVAALVILKWWRVRGLGEGEGWGLAAVFAAGFTVVSIIVTAIAAVPFSPTYWQDYRVEGTVLTVSNTWTDDGGDIARTPVVTLDTIDRPLVIDDPRAITEELGVES